MIPKRTDVEVISHLEAQDVQTLLCLEFFWAYVHKYGKGDQVHKNYRQNATEVSSHAQLEIEVLWIFDLFYSFFLLLKKSHFTEGFNFNREATFAK